MKKKLFFFLLSALLMSFGQSLCAYDAYVDGIYYNFSGTEAIVTNQGPKTTAYNERYFYYGNVTIPSSVTYNGTTYSVTSIGEEAFYFCVNLTSVTIPNGVTSIGRTAFGNCYELQNIEFPNSVNSIGESVFFNCTGLTNIIIPNGVTSIGDYAFYRCMAITSITIPNSVTNIGYHAFEGCI